MKCITWNVRGLRDANRRGIVGRCLREWGADIICLQETMICQADHSFWSTFGWGNAGASTSIAASGRSGGVLLAWNEGQFELISVWTGRHVAAARLAVWADGSQLIIASAYGPWVAQRQGELGEDISQLCSLFLEVPILIGGDLNVTIAPEDRPNDQGGCDPGSAQFRDIINRCGLQEMGPADRRFTWRGPTSQSRLDRFLCSIELLERFPLALVTALPRPLSDHCPLLWNSNVETVKPPYFKLDRSWLHHEVIKNNIQEWWDSQPALGAASERLT